MSKNNAREIVNKLRRCVGRCNGAQLLIGLTQSTRASADWSLPGQAELDGRSQFTPGAFPYYPSRRRAAPNVVSATFESIPDWPNLSRNAIRAFIFRKKYSTVISYQTNHSLHGLFWRHFHL